MDSRLRAFVEVAEQRRFGVAAERLSTTQPALTKQIQSLERELGAPLFHRGRHGATLTEFGQLLLQQARDLVAGADEFTRRARQLARGERGRLAVGFGLSTIELAPRAIAAFRQRYPWVEVSLEDLPSATQVERLRTGELHAGFIRLPAGSNLCEMVLRHERLAVAHTSAIPDDLPGWLGEQRLVRLARAAGSGLVAQIDRLCAAWRIQPGTAHETNHLHTVLALVAAGSGPALVPTSAATIAPAAVRLTPVSDPVATWAVGVVWRAEIDHAITTNFLAVVEAQLISSVQTAKSDLQA
jgi:DNA-binding transcriptional LysR family regulator